MAITRLGPNQDITAAKIAGTINFKNLIINGDMSIAQRGTSSSSVSTGYNTLDRFNIIQSNSSANWDESQSTDVPTGQGFFNSWKLLVSSGGAITGSQRTIVRQKFEGQNLQYLKKGTSSAESLTLSFWVKSSTTGTYICELRDNDNTRSISKSYTINSASTWEKKTLTFAGDTTGAFDNDNSASLDIWWWLDAGTDYTSGTLQTSWGARTNANSAVGQTNLGTTTNNEWYITGVQLEADTSASDFEFLPYDVNLQRCQRYFAKQTGGNATTLSMGTFYATNGWLGYLKFTTTMRSAPSLSTSGTFVIRSPAGAPTASSIAISGDAGVDSLSLEASATGTSGHGGLFRPDASGGSLSLDAEL